jgi:hypothetical protein
VNKNLGDWTRQGLLELVSGRMVILKIDEFRSLARMNED